MAGRKHDKRARHGAGRPGGRRGRPSSSGPNWVVGFHAVASLIRETPARVETLYVWTSHYDALLAEAAAAGVASRRAQPDQFAIDAHLAQGIAACVRPYDYTDLETLLPLPDSGHGLLIALDSVTDTRNLGAILRSAGFFGADGVILPRDRAAAVTSVTERIARGGAAVVPVAQVTNLSRALVKVADAGWTIVGTALEQADGSLWDETMSGPTCLVVGSEDRGMRRLVRAQCHRVITLQTVGTVQSLNVASFATLAMAEVRRQQD